MSKEFFLTNNQIVEISEIVKKHDFAFSASRINNDQNEKDGGAEISSLYSLFSRDLLSSAKFQDDLFEYIKGLNKFNLAYCYEKKLDSHSWNGDLLLSYTRFIKNGKYYPENEQSIYNSIKGQSSDSNKTFWTMISLSAAAKDDSVAAKCFHLVLKDKKRCAIPLLDLEKIKKNWDKRFNGVDVSIVAPQEYTYLSDLFSNIESSKNKDFFQIKEGHYLSIDINVDLISQSNKMSKNKNEEALRIFFIAFLKYSKKSKELQDVLSINAFTEESSGSKLIFYFSDFSKKNMIKSLVCDLVDYATTKFENNKLKGSSINEQDTEKFFSAFVLNYLLQKSLSDKSNKDLTPKKNKI